MNAIVSRGTTATTVAMIILTKQQQQQQYSHNRDDDIIVDQTMILNDFTALCKTTTAKTITIIMNHGFENAHIYYNG